MDTRRLILVLIFSFSLVMLWDAWQKHNAPKVLLPAPTATLDLPQPTGDLSVPKAALGTSAKVSQEADSAVVKAETVRLKTDLFLAEVSSQGGELVRLELLKHRATVDSTKNLVLFDTAHRYSAQSGLIGDGLPNHKTVYRIASSERDLGDGDQLVLRLEASSPEGVQVAKILTFKRNSYDIDIAYEIANKSTKLLNPHAYFQFQRDGNAPEGESAMVSTFTGLAVYTDAEKYQKIAFNDVEKGDAKFANKADNGWMALVQHYFVAAWLPASAQNREYFAKKIDTNLYTAGLILPVKEIASGDTVRINLPLYAGPQEQAKLKALAPGLDLVVDYGFLHIIAAPIFWLLQLIYDYVGNWGWAIVLLTILIKAVFFPLSAASYKSMAKMRVVTPRLMALKEKFGDDRQKLNQEMMELYRKEKINPLGGCLPILVQIPVFIALYWVLLGGVEMRGAPWLGWITDLSVQDPYYILPVIMVISMVIQTKLNPTPPDPIQAKVMTAMPYIFGVMFFWFPAGLVLYWVVNNVLSIAQQWQITRMIDRGAAK